MLNTTAAPADLYYSPAGGLGKIGSRFGTCVHSTFSFDAEAFGLSVGEACLMDPQQRVLLEETVTAFRMAGNSASTLLGSPTGVYVGCIWLEYGEQLSSAGIPAGAYMVTGEPSASMQTACMQR